MKKTYILADCAIVMINAQDIVTVSGELSVSEKNGGTVLNWGSDALYY